MLKPRQLDMLYLYIDDRLTLDEIGEIYGITRERVRQLITVFPEYKVIQKLRPILNKQYNKLRKSLRQYRDDDKVTRWFWNRVDKTGDCWEWIGNAHPITGYGTYKSPILEREYGAGDYVHRQVWCMSIGKSIPANAQINHVCDNPSCVNPAHLYLGNARTNANDREERGRSHNHRLSDVDRKNIKRIFEKEGIGCLDNLSDMYRVTKQYLYKLGTS